MKVISVINYKGGVGKTTITANLVSDLASRGKNVLAIDLDPQASLTFSFFKVDEWREKFEKSKTIKNWYDAFIDKDTELSLASLIARPTSINSEMQGRLDLICSHLALIDIDLELASRLSGVTERDLRNNQLRTLTRLKQGINSLGDSAYDYILIDCPPNFNIVTRTAIVASDFLLVPAKPDYLSTLGIAQLDKHVKGLVQTYNKNVNDSGNQDWQTINPEILGVLFTMVQIYNNNPISTQQQYISQIHSLSIPCFEICIRENKTIYGGAPESGVPVVLKRAASGQTYVDVRRELKDLTTEVLRKVVG
jgi:chromosome partitioning protein